MHMQIDRRSFLQMTAAGGTYCLGCPAVFGAVSGHWRQFSGSPLVSPGCRGTKVKVARLFLGSSHGLWPKPNLDFEEEMRFYRSRMDEIAELHDVTFSVDELVTTVEGAQSLRERLAAVDGILAIHLNLSIGQVLREILSVGRPTTVFAVPYSGHDWTWFGSLMDEPAGARMECLLTSDLSQLALAIRPFRAIHHLREAKILNVTTRSFEEYASAVREKFGAEIYPLSRERVLRAYEDVSERRARDETERWISEAEQVVEPSREEVYRSSRLALALQDLLDEEDATVMTVDCYGTMWDGTILLPAYPCLGFARLNNMGFGGICESDLQSAMTHVVFQGLSGRPGFISDPTVDESNGTIILAHCLGTPKMDGPDGSAAPYKLRTIMERQEGVVTQVRMRVGERVTQARLVGIDNLLYFTGEIVDAPVSLEHDRGCRTKIAVRTDGDIQTLWRNWSSGLHRVTCYGDITKELSHFCRFMDIRTENEAV